MYDASCFFWVRSMGRTIRFPLPKRVTRPFGSRQAKRETRFGDSECMVCSGSLSDQSRYNGFGDGLFLRNGDVRGDRHSGVGAGSRSSYQLLFQLAPLEVPRSAPQSGRFVCRLANKKLKLALLLANNLSKDYGVNPEPPVKPMNL